MPDNPPQEIEPHPLATMLLQALPPEMQHPVGVVLNRLSGRKLALVVLATASAGMAYGIIPKPQLLVDVIAYVKSSGNAPTQCPPLIPVPQPQG
jgi:hypothetical protein